MNSTPSISTVFEERVIIHIVNDRLQEITPSNVFDVIASDGATPGIGLAM